MSVTVMDGENKKDLLKSL